MSESGQIPTAEIVNSGVTWLNEEAMKIIEEASAIVEDNTKNKFPDLPLSDEGIVGYSSKETETSLY